MQAGALRVYKFWGPDAASVVSKGFNGRQGEIYWLYMTEIREGNAIDGAVTISGELRDENLNILETISITDNGGLAGQRIWPSSNKRGFGGYCAADGNGIKIFEWHVEALDSAADVAPEAPTNLTVSDD